MANSVWIGYLGPTQVTSDGSGIVFPGTVTATRFLAGDGTEAAPAFSFTNDTNTGFYNPGNQLYVSVNGTTRGLWDASGYGVGTNPIYWGGGVGSNDLSLVRTGARSLVCGPTTGVTLRWATNGTLEIRNFANSAAGNLTALQVTTATAASFLATSVALTDGAGAGAGTITNAPSAGNPTKWIGINDNGTVRYVPAW